MTFRETQRAKFLAKPFINYASGPVYDWDGDQYFSDLQECLDVLADDEIDPMDRVIFPCSEERVGTPNLAELVDEAWGEELDDWQGLSKDVEECLDVCYQLIKDKAPNVWYPDFAGRLQVSP